MTMLSGKTTLVTRRRDCWRTSLVGPSLHHQSRRLTCAFGVSAQPVDATQALNLSAGVSNVKVLRGRARRPGPRACAGGSHTAIHAPQLNCGKLQRLFFSNIHEAGHGVPRRSSERFSYRRPQASNSLMISRARAAVKFFNARAASNSLMISRARAGIRTWRLPSLGRSFYRERSRWWFLCLFKDQQSYWPPRPVAYRKRRRAVS